jgi:hypothetical protein
MWPDNTLSVKQTSSHRSIQRPRTKPASENIAKMSYFTFLFILFLVLPLVSAQYAAPGEKVTLRTEPGIYGHELEEFHYYYEQ